MDYYILYTLWISGFETGAVCVCVCAAAKLKIHTKQYETSKNDYNTKADKQISTRVAGGSVPSVCNAVALLQQL